MTDQFISSVVIYTDGACDPNPGPGGWAALLQFKGQEKVLTGREESTTNNRMELTAAIRALQTLRSPCVIDVYTDSEYLKKGITEWLPAWRRQNWRRKSGSLANADLWRTLDAAQKPHTIHWHWVRGHTGHPQNERVDRLARQSIKK
jgi:ribonuclease HI